MEHDEKTVAKNEHFSINDARSTISNEQKDLKIPNIHDNADSNLTIKRKRCEDTAETTNTAEKSTTTAEIASHYLSNELSVAIMTEPFSYMTQGQVEQIQRKLEEILSKELLANTFSIPTESIRFRGTPHFSEGVLKAWCEDHYALNWLNNSILDIPSPIENTKLVVRSQAAIPRKVACTLFVPDFNGNTEDVLRLLASQNGNLNIGTWRVTHSKLRQNPRGTCLFLRIPSTDVNVLKTREFRVNYLLGNIYMRFPNKIVPPTLQPETLEVPTSVLQVSSQNFDLESPSTSSKVPSTSKSILTTTPNPASAVHSALDTPSTSSEVLPMEYILHAVPSTSSRPPTVSKPALVSRPSTKEASFQDMPISSRLTEELLESAAMKLANAIGDEAPASPVSSEFGSWNGDSFEEEEESD